ncbi:MAG: N-acetylmuramoyl-L-alanine amidase LytC [Firmicutes bacterium]|nr:N-acetylmuramoyl-L-alanine amidase LytC [candidate division NPL-UPA2 bacterium]
MGPTGVQEKVVVLAVALRVRELLQGRATVHMTRTTDVDVPLVRRLAAPGAACFVSIHCNAHATRTANGIETFRFAGGHHRSGLLATILQRHLVAQLRLRDRGVKTAAFQVLRQATVPAVLLELGFISNHVEEALLESEVGQERAAQAIVAGLTEFLGLPQIHRQVHVVVSGDTLWSLSRMYGVTEAQLREWNRLTTDVLRVGQRLNIADG